MTKLLKAAAIAAAITFAACPAGMAAKAKPKVAPKKPVAKTTNHAKLGTTQLKSLDNPEFGGTYTLGKSDPMNITLRSAEYSVQPITIGDNTYTVSAEEKFLVLHLTYHNPQKEERFVRWDTFGFTVVDPKDKNHDGLKDLGTDEKVITTFSMSMKPAQKNEVVGIMVVPADAEMPKLIIKGSDDLVMRYDLRGKVKGLPAPYADPADKTGATALAKVPAVQGTQYPVDEFQFKLNKVECIPDTKIGDKELDEGNKFVVVSFSLKNVGASKQFYRWDTLPNKLIDSDDITVADGCYDVYQASKYKAFSGDIQPGQELNLRYVYDVPGDTDLKTFTIGGPDDGRTFEFDIAGTK